MTSKEENKANKIGGVIGGFVATVFSCFVLAWLFIYAFDWLAVKSAWSISIPKTFSCSLAVTAMLWCVKS